jgi:hypothetical protein
LIAAILERMPEPISAMQPVTPPALDRLVRTCIAEDSDERRARGGQFTLVLNPKRPRSGD